MTYSIYYPHKSDWIYISRIKYTTHTRYISRIRYTAHTKYIVYIAN